MVEESVSILRVDTGEAVKSVNDLKNNIKLLKGQLGDLTIGTDEYKDTLDELKINQNALKDAMYATTASLADVADAAKGANVQWDENNKLINQGNISYNELVHTMAALKEEWRATTDAVRRSELGEQIEEINNQLKGMDASVGNFQRNVGNYESGVAGLVAKFDQWGETLKMFPPTLGAAKESIGKVGETMQLVGKQPILGIIGLLAPIIMKITSALQENETAMDAVKRVMASLQPVFDVLQGVIEAVAQALSTAVDWFINFIGQSDGVKKVISSIIGVGNSILQYLLAPIKSAVAAFKGLGKIIGDVFKGDWTEIKTHAKQTGQEIADAYKEGFSFKANFEEGKEAGAKFVSGVKAKENVEKAKEAGKEIAKAVKEGIDEEYEGFVEDDPWAEWEADEEKRKSSKEKDDALFADLAAQVDAREAAAQREIEIEKAVTEAVKAELEAQEIARKEAAEALVANTMAVADATSGLISSLADMYESDEKNAEKNAKKVKALRIASATIDMLNGAVGAFSSAAANPGGIPGMIIGAANAASVIAMGIANINKIRSTDPSGSASAPSATPAVVSSPNIDTGLQSVRNVTTASEEERLNRMASSQRVYILQSDIEAAEEQSKVQVKESSF